MSRSRTWNLFRPVACVLFAAGGLVVGCGGGGEDGANKVTVDSDPEPTAEECEPPTTGTLEAGESVRELGVESYEYEANRAEGTGTLKLISESGEEMGTFELELDVSSLQPLRFEAVTRLERGGETVARRTSKVRSVARTGGIAESTLRVGETVERRWTRIDAQGSIQKMTFGRPVDGGSVVGEERQTEDGAYDVVEVDFTADFDANAVAEWRKEAGAGEAFTSGDGALFRAVASDETWMRGMVEFWESCTSVGAPKESQSQGLRTTAQRLGEEEATRRRVMAQCRENAAGSFGKVNKIAGVLGAVDDGVAIAGAMAAGGGAGAALVAAHPVAVPALAAGGAYLASQAASKAAGPAVEGGFRAAGKDEAADFFGGGDGGGGGGSDGGGSGGGSDGASSTGDPHLTTLDGVAYDFQAVGEFDFATTRGAGEFRLQVRQAAQHGERCPNIAINTAVAARVGGERIGIYANRSSTLYISGEPAELGAEFREIGDGGMLVRESSDVYRIVWPNNASAIVSVYGSRVDLREVEVPDELRGQVYGLVGRYNGDPADDFTLRDGTVLEQPVDWDRLYGAFADSWRVTDETSLFDYESGQSTAEYTNRDAPGRPASVDDIPDAKADEARTTCQERGVEGERVMQDCILDVYCSGGDTSYAEEHAKREEPDSEVELEIPIFFDGWFPVGTGSWEVDGSGRSLLQTVNVNWPNGNNFPGMFISPNEYGPATIRGSFTPTQEGSGDWVGLVFGYQRPLESDPRDSTDYDMWLFAWKHKDQDEARAGYSLIHVDGDLQQPKPVFAEFKDTANSERAAVDFGSDKGWVGGRRYDFSLLYTQSKIHITIDGETIFEIDADQVEAGFDPGRFGFYNFSQSDVRYSNFSAGPPVDDLSADEFSFPVFEKRGKVQPTGDASLETGRLRLTESSGNQAGAAWYRGAPAVAGGFETEFTFRMSDPESSNGETGGEGLAFVVQNTREGFRRSAGSGDAPGYGGIPNSLAVEFDTYQNASDNDGNHVAIHSNGTDPNGAGAGAKLAEASISAPADLIDGQSHDVRIVYDADDTELRLFLDGRRILSSSVDLGGRLDLDEGDAHVGFTSSTGSGAAQHEISNWEFRSETGGP